MDLSTLPNVGVKKALLTLNVLSVNKSQQYDANLVTSFWTEADASWNNRVAGTAWAAPGGAFNATATATISLTAATPTVAQWDITPDAQSWYTGTPNYGTLIKQNLAKGNDPTGITISSKEDATAAKRPALVVTFLQNVSNLTATAGNGAVTLSWSNPTPMAGSIVNGAYTGVLILRMKDQPVDPASVPVDGTTYTTAACNVIGAGVAAELVYVNEASAATFTDNGSDPCGAPANGSVYYYQVFAMDALHRYSTNASAGYTSPASPGIGVPEISALPDAAAPQQTLWMLSSGAASLAAPGLNPGSNVVTGAGNNLVYNVNPASGALLYPPLSLGGAVSSQAVVLDAATSSLSKNVTYLPALDGFVYAADVSSGQFLWVANPTATSTNKFSGGAAVFLKLYSGGTYTLSTDLVVVGTNTGAATTNQVFGLNGNGTAGTMTTSTVWAFPATAGATAMDIINSTPFIDFARSVVWVTSRSNGGTQPSLWKLNANTGAVLFSVNLGGDIDSSPLLTAAGDVLFVGNNAGTLYAINPVTGATLGSFAGGDGAIVGYPVVLTNGPVYTVAFSGTSKVQAVTFSTATNTFSAAALWSTQVTKPAAPLGFSGLANIYVGTGDGYILELNASTGAIGKSHPLNIKLPSVVSNLAIDSSLSRILASGTDGRTYVFNVPF